LKPQKIDRFSNNFRYLGTFTGVPYVSAVLWIRNFLQYTEPDPELEVMDPAPEPVPELYLNLT
jgi:hypothetical protein